MRSHHNFKFGRPNKIIRIKDFINRPIIRTTFSHELINKMTSEELKIFYDNIQYELSREKSYIYPSSTEAFYSKMMEAQILYDLMACFPQLITE